jgi:hypothetical protein
LHLASQTKRRARANRNFNPNPSARSGRRAEERFSLVVRVAGHQHHQPSLISFIFNSGAISSLSVARQSFAVERLWTRRKAQPKQKGRAALITPRVIPTRHKYPSATTIAPSEATHEEKLRATGKKGKTWNEAKEEEEEKL